MSNEIPSEVIPTATLVHGPQVGQPSCAHCGGHDLTTGLKLGLTANAGNFGIKYVATGTFLGVALLGIEPLNVDICNACRTVARVYVNAVDRKWKKERRATPRQGRETRAERVS